MIIVQFFNPLATVSPGVKTMGGRALIQRVRVYTCINYFRLYRTRKIQNVLLSNAV
jgi:hypothetical protein